MTLRTADGAMALTGEIISIEDGMIAIVASVGEVTVPAALVACEGAACPDLGREDDRVALAGSSILAARLAPALTLGLADILDADVEQALEGDALSMDIRDFDGTGLAVVEVALGDAAAGFDALFRNRAAAAIASRAITEAEAARFDAAGFGDMRAAGRENVVALDGFAAIVGAGNPVVVLSLEEIAGIFSGETEDWSAVGEAEGQIAVHVRDEASDDGAAFVALLEARSGGVLADSEGRLTADVVRHGDDAALEAAVASDPRAIGVVSISSLRRTRALGVRTACGQVTTPDPFALRAEEYPLSRRLYLYAHDGPIPSWARDLIDFAVSAEAQPAIAEAGFTDQAAVAQPRAGMADRLALATSDLHAEIDLQDLRAFVAETSGATRLSTTLRFGPDGVDLDSKAARDVPRLIDTLAAADLAGREVVLMGFTDSAGAADENRAVSQAMAERALAAIRAAAPEGAIDRVGMRAVGFGETAPAVCNATAAGDPANRRVEIWIRDKG